MTEQEKAVEQVWLERLNIRPFLSPLFPEIVCLCGSTRFGDAFRRAMRDETLAGRIVLTVGLLGHAEGIDMDGPVKEALDRLHFYKIDLADEILVLSVGGYIGKSTRNEIDYAVSKGKRIRWLEESAKENYHAMAQGKKDV